MNINGFEVIAHNGIDSLFDKSTIILGHRSTQYGHGHEYVVANVESLASKHWGNGQYTFNLAEAMNYYITHGGA